MPDLQKYIEDGGVRCMCCGSEDLGGDSFDIEAGYVTQLIHCHDCLAEWRDIYKLVDFDSIYQPEGGST